MNVSERQTEIRINDKLKKEHLIKTEVKRLKWEGKDHPGDSGFARLIILGKDTRKPGPPAYKLMLVHVLRGLGKDQGVRRE